MSTVTLVDTSVLCELLQVPGKSSPKKGAEAVAAADERWRAGERLVIPITTVIETGNHIAQSPNAYVVAGAFVRLLQDAISETSPWSVLQTELGKDFLRSLCAGAFTGESFECLAARKVGAGDVAILVERNYLRTVSAVGTVQVWTYDNDLSNLARSKK